MSSRAQEPRLLRGARRLRVTLEVVVLTDASGNRRTLRRTIRAG